MSKNFGFHVFFFVAKMRFHTYWMVIVAVGFLDCTAEARVRKSDIKKNEKLQKDSPQAQQAEYGEDDYDNYDDYDYTDKNSKSIQKTFHLVSTNVSF